MASRRSLVPKTRTFSKRLVVACVALAWCALFYAIYAAQATVAVAGFTFIAGLGGTYMGIGHMDLRQLLQALSPSDPASTYNGPAMPEPPGDQP
jgi:hypothetical protein